MSAWGIGTGSRRRCHDPVDIVTGVIVGCTEDEGLAPREVAETIVKVLQQEGYL